MSSSLNTNLISYWKLDEADGSTGHTAYDAVNYPSGNNGAFTDVTQSSANGKLPTGSPIGAGFNGTTSKIDVGNNSSLNLTSNLTISAWIKTTTILSKYIFNRYDISNSYVGYSFEVSPTTGYLNFYNGTTVVNSASAVNSGNWVHCVVTNDGTNTKFYINGTLTNTIAQGNPNSATVSAAIGWATGTVSYFNGSIDEVGIWSRALSSQEVQQLFNFGNGNQYPFSQEFNMLNLF